MSADTEGVGLTVIVNAWAVPVHEFAVGVAVIVATIGLDVAFVAVNAAILPEPLVAKPTLVVLFAQL